MHNYNFINMRYPYYSTFLILLFTVLISGKSYLSASSGNSSKALVVVIDPGHGGKDPGAVSRGIREKDVVLGIGLKLGKYINDNYPDVKVVFTRNTDVFVPLIDRSKIANKNKADLFISLHANHCGTPAIRGTETFVLGLHRSEDNLEVAKKENSVILLEEDYTTTYEGFDPNLSESYIMFELVQDLYLDQSLTFADAIQNQFKSRLSTSNRGVKQAGFLVLRQSSMPSVLIETGFLSNSAEAGYLASEEGQNNLALSIFEAFRKFKSRNSGSGNQVVAGNQAAGSTTVPQKQEQKSTEKQELKKPESAKTADSTVKTVAANKKTEAKSEITQAAVPLPNNLPTDSNIYYSVQIGANTTPVEPVAANFKGLKEVRREKTDKYYRYYIGKENSIEKITPLWQQIKLKFPQAFIVSFTDGKRIIIDITSYR